MAEEVGEIFSSLGFPVPSPVPLMSLEYQVAQKLHGATEPDSKRAHDLIDLQIIAGSRNLDLKRLNALCRRLFAYRKMQKWPTQVVKNPDWSGIYDQERGELPVLPTVDEAIAWTNDLIAKIAAAE